jgi:predicted ATPase
MMATMGLKSLEKKKMKEFEEESAPKSRHKGSMSSPSNFNMDQFAEGYLESQLMAKRETLMELEAALQAMPDKSSFKAQCMAQWLAFYEEEYVEEWADFVFS